MALTDKLTSLGNAIRSKTGENAKLSLDEMEAIILGSLAVNPTPTYIVAEAERVASLAKASNFNIVSGADIHLYSANSSHDKSLVSAQYAGMGIKELQKLLTIDCIALAGDYSYMSSSSYNSEQVKKDVLLSEVALDLNGTQIWCVGNHDWCYGSGVDRMLSADEVYNLIGSKSDGVKHSGQENRCYGYVDFPTDKIRVIYLNTNDCKDGIANGGVTKDSYGYIEFISPTQFRWVADVALNFTESGWGVVFVSHQPLDYGYTWFKNFLKMLEAYKDGVNTTLWLHEYIANGQTVGHNETFNFANYKNRAEIICNIHGHNHNCADSKVSSADTVEPWLWRFCVPNMCANRYNESATVESRKYMGEFDSNGNPVYWKKEDETAKATSFNLISIDRTNKMIYAYIFGAGRDRSMYYGEYIPAEYTITTKLTNCIGVSSNPTTIIENGTATLTFTANDGYKLPDAVNVTGASYNWDKLSGTLTLSNPTSDISVIVIAVEASSTYTNLLPLATTSPTDNTIYGEDYDGDGKNDGYKKDTRFSTSNGIITASGYQLTGFIPTSAGDIIRIKGVTEIMFYMCIEADGTVSAQIPSDYYASEYTSPDENGVYTFRAPSNHYAGVRFSGTGISGDTIITKNQPISQDEDETPIEYSISVSANNCTASSGNPTTIIENSTATLTFTANNGYELPDSVTVTGATYTWNKASGILTLSAPISNVSISVTATEVVIEPSYNNLIKSVGYDATTRLITGGATETRSGCGTTGFIEVPTPANDSQGQIVFRIKNAEITVSNTSLTRFAIYDADKTNLAFGNVNSVAVTSYTNYKLYYEADSNGYVTLYDFSTYIRTLIANGKSPKYVKICGAGIDDDTIITLNEPIE